MAGVQGVDMSDAQFGYLRHTPWKPTFDWVPNITQAADQINSWHEDYPLRVTATIRALETAWLYDLNLIGKEILLDLHMTMFGDKEFAGRWRDVGVIVGSHAPPTYEQIPSLMDSLVQAYSGLDFGTSLLEAWYTDFETIHPFQDGNGRVGGVIVAAFSNRLHPQKGWLAPNQ